MKTQNVRGFWFGFNLSAVVLIVFFLALPFLHAIGASKTAFFFLHNTGEMTPEGLGTMSVGLTNPDTLDLNAAEFELVFDPHAIEVVDITPTNALCEDRFILGKNIHNASGTALFQCGTITPFSGEETTLATVVFRHKSAGSTTISFGSTTHALMHDGYGTDATGGTRALTISLPR